MVSFRPLESPYKSESLQCFMDGVSDFHWVVAPTTPRARAKFVYAQEVGEFCGYTGCFTRRHGLASYLIKITTAGEGVLQYDDVEYRVPLGSFFWIDCQKPQYYATAPEASQWAVVCIHLHGGVSKTYYDSFMVQNNYRPVGVLDDPDASIRIIRQIRELYAAAHYDYFTDVKVSALITTLLTNCLSSALISYSEEAANYAVPAFLQQVHTYIFNHYTEKLTLDALSSIFLVNKFYLQKQFRQFFGYTPIEYQNLLRVAKAKELLRKSSMSVSEIAYFLGLESASYFIQLFKKTEGSTPRQYRLEWNHPI